MLGQPRISLKEVHRALRILGGVLLSIGRPGSFHLPTPHGRAVMVPWPLQGNGAR
jgi:hypothetical protein